MLPEIPVSSLVTRSRLREFLVTKFSLEQYHTCSWVVATDKESQEFLRALYPEHQWLHVIDEEESQIKDEHEKFMLINLQKMSIMRECIKRLGATLFIDCDMLFTAPLPLEVMDDVPLVVSNRYISEREFTETYGTYSTAMVYCRDSGLIDEWQRRSTETFDPKGLEQKSFEHTVHAATCKWREFGLGCNLDWWRAKYDANFSAALSATGGKIQLRDEEVRNFHLPLELEIASRDEENFADLALKLLETSDKSEHRALRAYIRELLER